MLNEQFDKILEYTSNEDIFGYEDDPISKAYKPTDMVPVNVKRLFISNVMTRFNNLFNIK